MEKIDKRITPDHITELSQCEIFVFGSNLEGRHGGGAARFAYEKFGAIWGQGVGPQGRCYAIPTMQGPVETIKPYVDEFILYAKEHPENRFLVTRVGCGIAGFKDREMAPLFTEAVYLPNISLPEEWFGWILPYFDSTRRAEPITPPVINLKVLFRLCEEYKYIIGSGIRWKIPEVSIRYVLEEGEFGYAHFGNFFFFAEDLYVFETDDAFAEDHNPDVVECIFKDECFGRGYAHRVLFAGVRTPYKDSNRDYIYTGDVCHFKFHGTEYDLPLSTLGSEDNPEFFRYAFVLDNHCIYPEECESLTRVGTVFYMLDPRDTTEVFDQKCWEFTDLRGMNPNSLEERLEMAVFTPSFHKRYWEYAAMKVLEIEYDWRYYPGRPKPDED